MTRARWVLAGLMFATVLPSVPLQAAAPRKYYLTRGVYTGSQALGACARGFHLASPWEINEPSNLVYDVKRGVRNAPHHFGPPISYTSIPIQGWVDFNFDNAEVDSCLYWTTDVGYNGWAASVRTPGGLGGAWAYQQVDCGEALPVWCVSNAP